MKPKREKTELYLVCQLGPKSALYVEVVIEVTVLFPGMPISEGSSLHLICPGNRACLIISDTVVRVLSPVILPASHSFLDLIVPSIKEGSLTYLIPKILIIRVSRVLCIV